MKFVDSDINYWFSSDFHGYHKNICKGITKWSDISGCRDFKDEVEMTNHIVNNINNYVMPEDVLFFVGDFTFGGIQNIWNLRKRLNVKTIYFCIGNHDHHIENKKVLPNCHAKSNDGVRWNLFDGPPNYRNYDIDVTAKNIFNDVQHMYNVQVHGQRITLCHYSMRTWFYHNKGSWMLFGHSHDSLRPEGKTMDVGIDTAKRILGEYRPFKFQEIQKIMSKREFVQEDSHDSNTNAR